MRRTIFCRSTISSDCAEVVQPLKESGQGFGESQERHPVGGLIEDGLHFRPHGLFAGAQFQHSAPQFVEG